MLGHNSIGRFVIDENIDLDAIDQRF